MKLALCFLGLAVLASATVLPKVQKKVAPEGLALKQKQLMQLLWRPSQPLLNKEVETIGLNWDIQANFDKYTNVDAVKYFISNYKRGMLPMNQAFTVFNSQQRNDVVSLYNLFYFAKDYDTFYKTAVWARVHVHPAYFHYAMSVVVLHRDDLQGIVMPAAYEFYPQLFVDNEVIEQAMTKRQLLPKTEYGNTFVINVNKTGLYPFFHYNDHESHNNYRANLYGYETLHHSNPEDRVSYFTEDISLNSWYNYYHIQNPFWMNAHYNYKNDVRGEQFYFLHQQLLARYIMERFSNDLQDIDVLNYDVPLELGYNPRLKHYNGDAFPVRPDHIDVKAINSYEVQLVEDFERRIRDAIDIGFVVTKTGEKVQLTEEKGIEILAQLIESTVDTVHYSYYGKLYRLSLQLLGHIVDPHHYNQVIPGVLERYETVLRDPVYYRFLASITRLFLRYKSLLPRYTRDNLLFQGVKVDSVETEKLITYFEPYEFDISQAVKISKQEEDMVIKARQYRLNHTPFNVKINVQSDKEADVSVRIYLGPKYDSEGRVLSWNEKRRLMVELDRFPYKLVSGQNMITRNSRDILFTSDDKVTARDFYKTISEIVEAKSQYLIDDVDRQCAFPNRLLLPKGKRGGMPFTIFVAVSPITKETKTDMFYGCGAGYGLFYKDQYAMGYPFDRVIDETQFYVPNFYEKDVMIFHKRAEDINNKSI